jgi:hypothetical protein
MTSIHPDEDPMNVASVVLPDVPREPKPIFWVDIPKNPGRMADLDEGWENIDSFPTKLEAEEFCLLTWGMSAEQSAAFITEGQDV